MFAIYINLWSNFGGFGPKFVWVLVNRNPHSMSDNSGEHILSINYLVDISQNSSH